MKPFSLERAKAGDPIQTRNGRKAKFITHVTGLKSENRLIVAVGERDALTSYFEDGRFYSDQEGSLDLFMAPKTRTVYVNFYRDGIGVWARCHNTAEEAYRMSGDRIGNRAYPVEIDE